MSVPPGATPIGSKLFIFKSKSNNTDALISAHGGYHKGTSPFDVPKGVTLYFYGEADKVLSDPGVKLADMNAVPVEQISSGTCTNYVLSKYQGSHAGAKGKPAETYGSISNRIDLQDQNIDKMFQSLLTSTNQKFSDALLKRIMGARAMSVITIRNRWTGGDVYLKDLVREVNKAFPLIKNFHCSFCRGLIGNDNAETSHVKFG